MERDSGVLAIEGQRVYWKIDGYDHERRYGSEYLPTPTFSRSSCPRSTETSLPGIALGGVFHSFVDHRVDDSGMTIQCAL